MSYPFATPDDVVRQVLEGLHSCGTEDGRVWPKGDMLRAPVLNLPVVASDVHAIMAAVEQALDSPGKTLLPVREVIVNPLQGVVLVVANRRRMTEILPVSK